MRRCYSQALVRPRAEVVLVPSSLLSFVTTVQEIGIVVPNIDEKGVTL